MPRSRTIKTLVALIGAMCVGTFGLLTLETDPPRTGPAPTLAAVDRTAEPAPYMNEIYSAIVPPQEHKWQYVVIHDSVCAMTGNSVDGSHFLVYPDGRISVTPLWRDQANGNHIFLPGQGKYNTQSIGVCLVGDTAGQAPSARQMQNALGLIRSLQRVLYIDAQYVYLHGELSDTACPGEQFPVSEFRSRLLTSAR